MDEEPLTADENRLVAGKVFVESEKFHVVVLHEKLSQRRCDKFIINLALAYEKLGNQVTIWTSEYDLHESISDIRFSDKLLIQLCGGWIPSAFVGMFQDMLSAWKAMWMAFMLLLFPLDPKPDLIILDASLWALFILKYFTDYKVFYVEDFMDLKNSSVCSEHSKLNPSLITVRGIKMADEIIVESEAYAEILMKSVPSLRKKPRVFYPSVDLGLWREPGINIGRVLPDFTEEMVIVLALGKFRKSSNFDLALQAFELVLGSLEDNFLAKRLHLVVAGRCVSAAEVFYYRDLVNTNIRCPYASQVTFIKQLPTIHEKTLIAEACVVIHPAKNDVHSEYLLKAMSLGRPILAANKGIAPKILIHRMSGLVVEPKPQYFAVALKKLVTSPHVQLFLGDTARDMFEKCYSFNSFCEQVNFMMMREPRSYSSMALIKA